MNVEKLNSLALSLVEENNNLHYVKLFSDVTKTLQNIVNQPNQPQHQTNLATQLKSLQKALSNSLVNDFSPAWYQVLVELEIDDIMGNKLSKKINEIIQKNQITPAQAHQDLVKIYQKLNTKITGFTNIINGLKILDFGFDELKDNECEIGILIPRKYIENDLGKFGNEIKELNFILNNYSELIIGKKESFQIRNLSTSEPLITVATITAIAAGIAKTIGWLIDNYKKLLEIKQLKQKLKEQGLSNEELKGIDKHSNDFMEKAIDDIVNKMAKEYSGNGDNARKNELLNGIRISLNKIANRIDKGFNFEVRIQTDIDKSKAEDKEIIDIIEASNSLQFIKSTGDSILSLSEKK